MHVAVLRCKAKKKEVLIDTMPKSLTDGLELLTMSYANFRKLIFQIGTKRLQFLMYCAIIYSVELLFGSDCDITIC